MKTDNKDTKKSTKSVAKQVNSKPVSKPINNDKVAIADSPCRNCTEELATTNEIKPTRIILEFDNALGKAETWFKKLWKKIVAFFKKK